MIEHGFAPEILGEQVEVCLFQLPQRWIQIHALKTVLSMLAELVREMQIGDFGRNHVVESYHKELLRLENIAVRHLDYTGYREVAPQRRTFQIAEKLPMSMPFVKPPYRYDIYSLAARQQYHKTVHYFRS